MSEIFAKHQEAHNLNEKRPSTEASTDLNPILELSHGSFNSAVIKLFQQLVTDFLETNENQDLSKREPRTVPNELELECERKGSRMAP